MFELIFTEAEATIVFGFLSSIVVPFVVSLLKRYDWHNAAKLGLAAVVSLAGGLLTEFIAGSFDSPDPISVITIASVVFTASQAHFATWFKGLGLEDMLNPDKNADPANESLHQIIDVELED